MRGQGTDGSWQKYTYNAANQLVKVTIDANGYQAEYTCGASSQRLMATQGSAETVYAWDGGQVVAEYSSATSSSTLTWQKGYV